MTDPTAFLSEHAAFVLSSRDEGFASVIVKAMACALPVVAFNVDFGPRELIVPGVTGHLVADGDLGAFAQAMSELASQPERARQMSEAGRTQSIKRYSLESMTQSFHDLFHATSSRESDVLRS